MMRLHDNIPVVEMPDGRSALADTGFNGVDIIVSRDPTPVSIGDRVFQPTITSVDLAGIGRAIGAAELDMLIGAGVLREGFSADLRKGTFTFVATEARPDEKVVAVLPYTQPASNVALSPFIEFEIGGEWVSGIFDTGAPYSLWKRRSSDPQRSAEVKRTDFSRTTAVERPLIRFQRPTRPMPMVDRTAR